MIRETVVDSIQNSEFTDNQLITIVFEKSNLKMFTGNTFNGMNKAIQFKKSSTGVIANSFFYNMIQNIKDGSFYQSNIATDGSAIGKNSL